MINAGLFCCCLKSTTKGINNSISSNTMSVKMSTQEHRYGTSEFEKLGITVLRIKLSKFRNCLLPDKIDDLTNPWI